MLAALKTRDFRLLWGGQAVSFVGDQFHLIALPWLVLTLTHDPVQLGIVLALAGIPRAALMLLGGAYADRHSPRTIMLVSDLSRLALVIVLAGATLTGSVQMWMIYLLALSFGVASGFFMPAGEAALPRLVDNEHLESGNALMLGVGQLASFIGPVGAGTLIALFGAAHGATTRASLPGIGLAFVVDAATFAVSAATLWMIHSLPALGAAKDQHPLAAVAEGLRYAASVPAFRWLFGIIASANLLLMGPLTVGVPVIAQTRFTQGAFAYGIIIAAYGLGNVGGMLAGASLPRPAARVFTTVVVALLVGFGVVITAFGLVRSAWLGAAMIGVLGLGNGYIAVILMSTIQRLTPKEMLGRFMSLVMLAMLGVTPLSQAVAGVVVKAGPEALFFGAGAAMTLLGVFAGLRRKSWSLDRFADSTGSTEEPLPEAA